MTMCTDPNSPHGPYDTAPPTRRAATNENLSKTKDTPRALGGVRRTGLDRLTFAVNQTFFVSMTDLRNAALRPCLRASLGQPCLSRREPRSCWP